MAKGILITNGVNPLQVEAPALDPLESRGRRLVGVEMHGLEWSDNVVLGGHADGRPGDPAWHGMGLIIKGVTDPVEACRLGGIDYLVEQWPLSATNGEGTRTPITSHVANVRADNKAILGVVGSGYQICQNLDLAQFTLDVAGANASAVEVESVGTIDGGRRLWFLLRAGAYTVGKKDSVHTYAMFTNAHDGTGAVRGFYTSQRVVCKNTRRRAIAGQGDSGFIFRHTTSLTSRLAEAKEALGLTMASAEQEAVQAAALNGRKMTTQEVQAFFTEVYEAIENPIPKNPKTEEEKKRRQKAAEIIAQWSMNFDADRKRAGHDATAWVAANAVTEWVDHQRTVRAPNDDVREQRRLAYRLFRDAPKKEQVFSMAAAIV